MTDYNFSLCGCLEFIFFEPACREREGVHSTNLYRLRGVRYVAGDIAIIRRELGARSPDSDITVYTYDY